MKFKIDENLPGQASELLRKAGFESDTVAQEGLAGAGDEVIGSLLRAEGRVLITLDTDFGNIRAYPPDRYQGIELSRERQFERRSVFGFAFR